MSAVIIEWPGTPLSGDYPGHSFERFTERRELDFHPIANVFPLMEGEDFRELCKDIEKNGQQQPILTYEGKILDGRNRYRACKEVGEDPWTESWSGSNPVEAVLSLNLHRRHLTTGQKSAIAQEVEKLFAERAKTRVGGRPKKVVANLPQVSDDRILPDDGKAEEPEESGKARDEAARMLGVSPRSIQDAKKLSAVDPEAFESVRRGEVSLNKAMEPYRNPKPARELKEGGQESEKPTVGDMIASGLDFEVPPRKLSAEQKAFYDISQYLVRLKRMEPENVAEEWLEDGDEFEARQQMKDARFIVDWFGRYEKAMKSLSGRGLHVVGEE